MLSRFFSHRKHLLSLCSALGIQNTKWKWFPLHFHSTTCYLGTDHQNKWPALTAGWHRGMPVQEGSSSCRAHLCLAHSFLSFPQTAWLQGWELPQLQGLCTFDATTFWKTQFCWVACTEKGLACVETTFFSTSFSFSSSTPPLCKDRLFWKESPTHSSL